MHDLAVIIAAYVMLIVGLMAIGYCGRWALDRVKLNHARRMSVVRIPYERVFPIIDEWAKRPGNEWYWDFQEARHFAENEFGRLVRDEPGLTVEQSLARVTIAVKQRYPAAFQTLH